MYLLLATLNKACLLLTPAQQAPSAVAACIQLSSCSMHCHLPINQSTDTHHANIGHVSICC